MVFLLSDFHFDLELLTEVLRRLATHSVVPVVIWDSAEYRALPRRGLVRMQDSETGAERLLWWR